MGPAEIRASVGCRLEEVLEKTEIFLHVWPHEDCIYLCCDGADDGTDNKGDFGALHYCFGKLFSIVYS